jgi:large subunit ribosomal protein L28e
MAEALIWHCIRDHNSFLRKVGRTSRSGQVQFSAEPANLMSVNTFKFSGLANHKAVGLDGTSGKIVLQRKNAKSANKPAKAMSSIPLKAQKKRSLKVLANLVGTANHRADLTSAAKARFLRLHQATYARGSKPAVSRRGEKAIYGTGSGKKVHKHGSSE